MDTQRLILFVIFLFGAVPLGALAGRASAAGPATGNAASSAIERFGCSRSCRRDHAAAGTSAIPPTLPGAVPGVVTATSSPSEKVVVKTDLYTATVDTLGAVLTEIDLAAHRDTYDEQAVRTAAEKRRADLCRADGIARRGTSEPSNALAGAARAARAGSRRERARAQAAGDGCQRHQGRAEADAFIAAAMSSTSRTT